MSDTEPDVTSSETKEESKKTFHFSNPNFPTVSPQEIDLYLRAIQDEIKNINPQALHDHNCEDGDCNVPIPGIGDLLLFQQSLFNILSKTPELGKNIMRWKRMLIELNRTSTLCDAFTTGMIVGLLVGRPELLPSSSNEEESSLIS